ncbi:hypothetical protein NPIL_55541 [Nephila pilipes]|uniref:Uncharacterized protein n=1 Tax=Nephila pilipes TaxID=299642 RepID=A0A8X6MTW3_NEPPI|nr:hypothetical protein NPIL_55541 [Nephila pilipes]
MAINKHLILLINAERDTMQRKTLLLPSIFFPLDFDKSNANGTRCSQVVTLLSTDCTQRCTTAVIGREPVFSAWYGRWWRRISSLSLRSFSKRATRNIG